ncbi:MAG: ABC transporter permease [Blastocatellia bacterium AA13]|nr:MAG: ABC transporter permease [Blastocatellia bacterium AA13]
MKFIEAARLALSAIAAHKLRSFLTLLGIIVGVATVIVVVTLIEGFNKYFEEKVADLGSNAFVVNKLGLITSLQEFLDRNKKNKDIKLDDFHAIKEHPVYVKDAAAYSGKTVDVRRGSQVLNDIRLRGVTHNLIDIDTMKVGQGRYIGKEDEDNCSYTCFVGSNIADQFFPAVDPIGAEIKIDGRPFRIIGIAQAIGNIFGQPQDNFAIIPLATFQKIYGTRGWMNIKVSAISSESVERAIDEVRVTLRARRHLNYHDQDNFGIITSDAINNMREKIFGTISIVTIGVTSIALVVGGIVIMNIMLVSVTERTREIGVRKSLGARRRDILRQFLVESTVLSLIGGGIGVSIAYAIAKAGTAIFSLPTALPLVWTITALLVSGSIGLFFGIYPAWKAAKLDPINALRAE